jgi:hypothetical protein
MHRDVQEYKGFESEGINEYPVNDSILARAEKIERNNLYVWDMIRFFRLLPKNKHGRNVRKNRNTLNKFR